MPSCSTPRPLAPLNTGVRNTIEVFGNITNRESNRRSSTRDFSGSGFDSKFCFASQQGSCGGASTPRLPQGVLLTSASLSTPARSVSAPPTIAAADESGCSSPISPLHHWLIASGKVPQRDNSRRSRIASAPHPTDSCSPLDLLTSALQSPSGSWESPDLFRTRTSTGWCWCCAQDASLRTRCLVCRRRFAVCETCATIGVMGGERARGWYHAPRRRCTSCTSQHLDEASRSELVRARIEALHHVSSATAGPCAEAAGTEGTWLQGGSGCLPSASTALGSGPGGSGCLPSASKALGSGPSFTEGIIGAAKATGQTGLDVPCDSTPQIKHERGRQVAGQDQVSGNGTLEATIPGGHDLGNEVGSVVGVVGRPVGKELVARYEERTAGKQETEAGHERLVVRVMEEWMAPGRAAVGVGEDDGSRQSAAKKEGGGYVTMVGEEGSSEQAVCALKAGGTSGDTEACLPGLMGNAGASFKEAYAGVPFKETYAGVSFRGTSTGFEPEESRSRLRVSVAEALRFHAALNETQAASAPRGGATTRPGVALGAAPGGGISGDAFHAAAVPGCASHHAGAREAPMPCGPVDTVPYSERMLDTDSLVGNLEVALRRGLQELVEKALTGRLNWSENEPVSPAEVPGLLFASEVAGPLRMGEEAGAYTHTAGMGRAGVDDDVAGGLLGWTAADVEHWRAEIIRNRSVRAGERMGLQDGRNPREQDQRKQERAIANTEEYQLHHEQQHVPVYRTTAEDHFAPRREAFTDNEVNKGPQASCIDLEGGVFLDFLASCGLDANGLKDGSEKVCGWSRSSSAGDGSKDKSSSSGRSKASCKPVGNDQEKESSALKANLTQGAEWESRDSAATEPGYSRRSLSPSQGGPREKRVGSPPSSPPCASRSRMAAGPPAAAGNEGGDRLMRGFWVEM